MLGVSVHRVMGVCFGCVLGMPEGKQPCFPHRGSGFWGFLLRNLDPKSLGYRARHRQGFWAGVLLILKP